MGLHNEDKTKYMAVTKNRRGRDTGQSISIGDYNYFEKVREFVYLGAIITG